MRDDTQGIGTVTYVDLNGGFGALGHGISDSDTGELVQSQAVPFTPRKFWELRREVWKAGTFIRGDLLRTFL